MKRNLAVTLFFLVSLLTLSCSKVDQMFNNGKPISESRNAEHDFEEICIYNNVNVKLVRSNHPHLELTCPENLIDKVVTEVNGDSLVIRNDNNFNWLRSYDYDIDLTVYFDSLRKISYASIGDLICSDSIRGIRKLILDTINTEIDSTWAHTFILNIKEGSGNIDLTFNSEVLKTYFKNGTSEVTLRGLSSYTEILMRSFGVVHAENLSSDFVRVQSHSTNDAYVWARTELNVWLYSIGNVYYRGNPWIIQDCQGEGQIIKLE